MRSRYRPMQGAHEVAIIAICERDRRLCAAGPRAVKENIRVLIIRVRVKKPWRHNDITHVDTTLY